MWIGKCGLTLLLASIVVSGCSGPAYEQDTEPLLAWWLTTEFSPIESEVHGVPVSEVSMDWESASVLDEEFLATVLTESQLNDVNDTNLKSTVVADINDNHKPETFVAGIYKNISGEQGRFLIVLEDDKVIDHFEHSGFSGYNSLILSENSVRWYKCMQCSDYDTIRWSSGKFTIE